MKEQFLRYVCNGFPSPTLCRREVLVGMDLNTSIESHTWPRILIIIRETLRNENDKLCTNYEFENAETIVL